MSKVSIQRDICLPLVVPLTANHDYIPLPPFPPIPPPLPGVPFSLAAAAVEPPVNAFWPPGGAFGVHKFTSTVFHNGMQICLDGHDCGKFIPHLQVMPAPNNMLTFLHIPFSSRKANFAAGTVLMNGKATACMTMIAWPPTPMSYCANPFAMPLADAPTAHFNTVEVGMTLFDWLLGAAVIAAGIVIDTLTGKGTKGFGQGAGKDIAKSRAGESVASLIRSRALRSMADMTRGYALKQGVGVAAGVARISQSGVGTVAVIAPVGGGFFALKGTYSQTDSGTTAGVHGDFVTETGSITNDGVTSTSRDPFGRGQESTTQSWGGESTSTQTSTDPFNGFQNQSTTTGPDGTTTVSRSDAPSSTLPNRL